MLSVIDKLLNIYFGILIFYIFATWIPGLDWNKSPWSYLEKIACVYLGIFEKYMPRWGSIIAIILYRFVQNYFQLNML